MAKPKTKKQLNINIDHDQGAAFISKFRNYRLVLKSQVVKGDGKGNDIVEPGISVSFEEGVAIVDDMELVAAMLQRPEFGVEFCVDPADRTGFWAQFKETYSEEDLKDFLPMGLNEKAAANILHQFTQANRGRGTEVTIKVAAGVGLPIMDGGRDPISPAREKELRELGAL